MLLRYFQHKLVALLVLVGLVLSLPASVFAQTDGVEATATADSDDYHLFLPSLHPNLVTIANQEPTAPFVGNHQMFLPTVQTDLASELDAAAFDLCKTIAPNATLTLGFGIHNVTSSSPNANYSTVGCRRWVVNIKVPSNSSAPGDVDGFYFDSGNYPTSEPLCNAYRVEQSLYRKSASQTSFTLLNRGTLRGVWKKPAGVCTEQLVSGSDTGLYFPPNAGTDTYRVAIGAYINTTFGKAWQRVTVVADHPLDGPR